MKLTMPPYDAELVAAIEEHLEQDYWTEIEGTSGTASTPGCDVTRARGMRRKAYSRPMIQVYEDGLSSGMPVAQPACPSCGDFSRSWKCDVHESVKGFGMPRWLANAYRGRLERQQALLELVNEGSLQPIGPRVVGVDCETAEGVVSFTIEATRRRPDGG